VTDSRNAILGKIHIAKKQLRLDDDVYRDLLERVTGKRSAGDCGADELARVMQEFERRGFKEDRPHRRGGSGPNAGLVGKLYALWFCLWHLGEAVAPSDDTLLAFVQRQSGSSPSALRFATADQLSKAIEGLKQWLGRLDAFEPDSWNAVDVNRALVRALGHGYAALGRLKPFRDSGHERDALDKYLGATLRRHNTSLVALSDSELQAIIRVLARGLRAKRKRSASGELG
jgi:hypothetical protein